MVWWIVDGTVVRIGTLDRFGNEAIMETLAKRCSFVAVLDRKYAGDKIVRPIDLDFVQHNV